ncbi:hypothetical protein GJ496_010337 [Pomphorhynchus laevis]|nr:hypothetical protein GJ496_010337 [Pomphorhynchus laevis]
MGYGRGRIEYSLSPYQLNPYKNFFKKGIPVNYQMIKRELPFILIPAFCIYSLMVWADRANRRAFPQTTRSIR